MSCVVSLVLRMFGSSNLAEGIFVGQGENVKACLVKILKQP